MTTTPERVAAQVATIAKRRPEARVFGIHTTGPWSGGDSVIVDGRRMPVAYCRSPLEITAHLSSLPEEDSLVVLTPLTDQALGLDVLARLPGRRLNHLDRWELVRHAFGATHIDPRLPTHGWVAESLLGALPGGGFAPVPSGWLDADSAWRILLQCYLKLNTGRPDAVDLIHWSLDAEWVSRYRALPEPFRSGIRERLAETAGALGGILADAMESGQGTDLLPIGLVCEVLFVGEGPRSPALSQAVARLEPLVAGRTLNEDQGQAWFEAARNVFDRLDGMQRRDSIERAEHLLEALKAMSFTDRSTVLSAGFQQQLAAFGRILNAYLDGKAGPAEAEAALERVRRHRAREGDPERVERLEMAQRLVRRLGRGSAQAIPSLGKAIEAFVRDGVFVDWARRYLLGGDAIAELGTAFGRLYRRIRELREPENRRFAERLQEWNRAPKAERGFLPIEAFLDKVVAKVAAQAPVLVVVIDGMDGGVFEELAADLQQRGWLRWAPGLTGHRPASTAGEALLSVLPSVTEFSRTALLTGRVQPGSSSTEKTGFAAHAGLRAVSHLSRPPVLYHKGELTDTAAEGLSPTVRESLACPEQRVVGVVLNAVDDHLAKSEQLRLQWTVDSFRFLDALLYEARVAGRAVLITADHGHVLEEDGTRLPGDSEERWRSYGEPLAEQEMVFEGPRIETATRKRQVALLWSESARYCQKRNGYHGGATLQEAVVPLGVFLCVGQELAGCQPVAEYTPEWWWSPAVTDVVEPVPLKKGRRRPSPLPPGQARLFETLETASATATSDWIRWLFESEVYRAQSRLAGRLAPPEKIVRDVLSLLESRHRRAPRRVLAQAMGVPEFRLRGILAGLQRVLNVEGYQVLAVEEATGAVSVDVELLGKQFQLGVRP